MLLGPGWIVLCQLGASRAGRPFAPRSQLILVGPVLLFGIVAASGLANFLRTGSALPSADTELDILSAFTRPPGAWRFFWDGWLFPLAFLLPAAAMGLAFGELERNAGRGLLYLIGLPTLFLFAWGVSEYGGYTLGHAPFLAVFAAQAFPRPTGRAIALAALLLVSQAALAMWAIGSFDRGWDVNERAELVRQQLQGGVFVKTTDNAPALTVYIDDIVEVPLWDAVVRAHDGGLPDEEIQALLLSVARTHVQANGRVVFDLGYDTQRDREAIQPRLPFFDPLVKGLTAEFKTERIEHPHWPLLIVEPKK